MNIFRHGGKMGDVLFSLPAIKALDGGILYMPESTPDACDQLYSSMKDLLLLQPYLKEIMEYPSGYPYMKLAPGIPITHDLDIARLQPHRGLIHIVKRYLDTFNINLPNWKEPWLIVDGPLRTEEYVLINYTNRHVLNERSGKHSRVDWKKVLNSIEEKVFFVGHEKEYQYFCELTGQIIDLLPTNSVLDLARIVRGSKKVYCNQSLVLALAQSLGKQYWVAPKPGKRNCLLETPNEHILL